MVRIEHEPNDDPVAGEDLNPEGYPSDLQSDAFGRSANLPCTLFLQPRADNEITSSTPYRVKL